MCLPRENEALRTARHIAGQISRILLPNEDPNLILLDHGGFPEIQDTIKPVYRLKKGSKKLINVVVMNEGHGKWGGFATVVCGKKVRDFIYLPYSGVHETTTKPKKKKQKNKQKIE